MIPLLLVEMAFEAYLIVTIICGYYILRIFAIWQKIAKLSANFCDLEKSQKLNTRKNFYQHIRPSGLVCMYVQSQTAWCLIILFWSSLHFLFFLPFYNELDKETFDDIDDWQYCGLEVTVTSETACHIHYMSASGFQRWAFPLVARNRKV